MNSGTFHISSQEWRYFSREKSIVHTAHLAQLTPTRLGDTVLIAATAPSGTNQKTPGQRPMPLPSGPSYFTNLQYVTNSSLIIDCYGATNTLGIITAQSKMSIHVAGNQFITFNADESGFFVVGAYCYSDVMSASYQGAGNDGQISLKITSGGQIIAKAQARLHREGSYWQDPAIDADMVCRLSCGTSGLAGGGSFVVQAENLGADGALSAWCMKVANYD